MDLKAELKRRENTAGRMLQAFKQFGELNTTEMLKYFGTGCSSRLHELRVEGHSIVAVYERPGFYRYVYIGNKKDDDTKVSVVD